MLTAFDVFTPNDQPTHTYVERYAAMTERSINDALRSKGTVLSLSGPSKTGKTVVLRKVIDKDLLITVSGASVREVDDFWRGIMSWMEVPDTVTTTVSNTDIVSGKLSGATKADIAVVAVEGAIEVGKEKGTTREQTEVRQNRPFEQVVKEIGGSDYVVFLDDFHYIPRSIQAEVARQIKALAESGVRICTAAVPHRAEDVVRANPELRGRIIAVDSSYWELHELQQIAKKGFSALNLKLPDEVIDRLAHEAVGSPQLMQALCLNLFRVLGFEDKFATLQQMNVPEHQMAKILENTTQRADYSKLVEGLHSGPKIHGNPRSVYEFSDGSKGDVYRAILLALSQYPPRLSYRYDELMERVKMISKGDSPSASSCLLSTLFWTGRKTSSLSLIPILPFFCVAHRNSASSAPRCEYALEGAPLL